MTHKSQQIPKVPWVFWLSSKHYSFGNWCCHPNNTTLKVEGHLGLGKGTLLGIKEVK
jgi:hypothetical protein